VCSEESSVVDVDPGPDAGMSGERPIALLVVGGGPAGLAAATAYRMAGGDGRVRIVSADDHAPYFRPSLTKEYLRGEAGDQDMPLQQTAHYVEHALELTLSRAVTALDPVARTVTLDTGERLEYGDLVVATGSRPVVPAIDGAAHPGVLVLRSFAEGRRLRQAAEAAKRAVVVGSGFIGCEAAASLASRGVDVTVMSTEPRPQEQRIGPQAADRLAGWLEDAGVEVVGGVSVRAIEHAQRVVLDDRRAITADLILLATGIEPQSQLVADAGGAVVDQRVVVDERMRSTLPGVYAVGDIALAHNVSAGRSLKVEHWGEAEAMGEVAGTTAAGGDATWDHAPGFWTQIGRQTLKYAGWGDGQDAVRFVEHDDGAFTAWYGLDGKVVGALTHDADGDYDRGRELVERSAPFGATPT
jgi:3-phenylpropionate/trans-cinnamate dioxygenase ferredoxin reductase component